MANRQAPPHTGKTELGRFGEQLALQHLRQRHYQIIATNWRCVRGELDIIAQQEDTLVFVEVKTRRSVQVTDALVSITLRKRQRLIAAAHTYIAEQALDDPPWRIDVIAIALPPNRQPILEHVEDALDW